MSTLQDRLREAMQAAGLSNAQIARAAGVSRAAVSVWFTREPAIRELSSPVLLKVATACRVRPEWIATGVGPMRADAPLAVAESRATYFGVPNSREEAELGREWGKIEDLELRQQIWDLVFLLVAKQKQEARAPAGTARRSKRAPAAASPP